MGQFIGAIRPTIRDVRLHPWRSLAAIALIALTVGFLCYESVKSSSDRQFQELSFQNITLEYYGSSCKQNYSGDTYSCTNGVSSADGIQSDDNPPAANETISQQRISELLGNDFHVQILVTGAADISVGDRQVSVQMVQVPDSQMLPGAPEFGPTEVALGEYAAKHLGAEVGTQVDLKVNLDGNQHVTGTPERLTVATIVPGSNSYVVQPAMVSLDRIPAGTTSTFQLSSNRDLTWDEVEKLNQEGLVVRAHSFSNDPHTLRVDQMYPEYQDQLAQAQAMTPSTGWLVKVSEAVAYAMFYGLWMTMAFFLISPVFAIATSRQTKVYALMRTQGASRKHILLAVMAYGTIAGIIGASLGAILGSLVGYFSWVRSYPGWPVAIDIPHIAYMVAVTVVGATISAFLPALLSAKGSIMAGVAGAQPDRIRRWHKWMALGPIGLVVCGVLWTVYTVITNRSGMHYTQGESLILAVLTLVSFLCLFGSVPALIFSAGSINRPLSIRLAGRLVRRQAMKSTSIVLAMIGVTFIVTVFNVDAATSKAMNHARNSDSYNANFSLVDALQYTYADQEAYPAKDWEKLTEAEPPPQLGAALKQIDAMAEVSRLFPLYSVNKSDYAVTIELKNECTMRNQGAGDPTYLYQGKDAATDPTAAAHCLYLMRQDYGSYRSYDGLGLSQNILVGGPEVLDIFNIEPELKQQAAQTLADGGLVGSSDIKATGPQVVALASDSADYSSELTDEPQGEKQVGNEVTAPFTAALPSQQNVPWIISPELAEKLDAEIVSEGYGVVLKDQPSVAKLMEIREAIETSSGNQVALSTAFEVDGFDSDLTWALVILLLLVLGLVLVLSAQQMQRQNEQLYAIGADQSLLRKIGASYMAVLALLGTVPAVVLGHIAAVWFLDSSQTNINGDVFVAGDLDYYQLDWIGIGLLCLVVPLVAALMGFFAIRVNNLLSYRQD
jgi:hypothetical protein